MFEVDLSHMMSQFHYWEYFVPDPGGRAHGIYLLTVNSPDIVIGSWQVKDHFMSDPNTQTSAFYHTDPSSGLYCMCENLL